MRSTLFCCLAVLSTAACVGRGEQAESSCTVEANADGSSSIHCPAAPLLTVPARQAAAAGQVTLRDEPPGDHCAAGGQRLEDGASVRYLCSPLEAVLAVPTAAASRPTDVALCVSMAGNDLSGNGSPYAPFATIEKAASAAMLMPPGTPLEIRVAGGDYAVREPIAIGKSVRLLAGYDGRDWIGRDPAANPVSITDTGITATADGFRALVTITNGSGAGLDGFRLYPQTPAGTPVACVVSSGAVAIRNNTCTLHANGGLGVGVRHQGGAPLIEGNTLRLDAGPSPNGSLYGLSVTGAAPQIVRNDVRLATPYGRTQQGLVVAAVPSGATAIIANNMVDTGAQLSWVANSGIEAWGPGAKISIANNTVRFGNGPAQQAFGIGDGLSGEGAGTILTIENNIVFSSIDQGSNVVCVKTATAPGSLRNNDLFRCSGGLYATETSIDRLNASAGAGQNLSFDLVGANTWFIDDARDFRLRPGGSDPFVAVKTGGKVSGPGFDVDRDGQPRTGGAELGWSLGAYEQDL